MNTSPSVTAPSGRDTRASAAKTQAKGTTKSREELAAACKGPVRSAESGRAYLEKHHYAVVGQDYTATSLSHILLLLAQGAQTIILIEGTRAVVFILDLIEQEAEKQEIIKTLESYLENMSSKLGEASARLNEAADNVRGAAVGIDGVTGELRNKCHALTSQMEAAVEAIAEGVAKAEQHSQAAATHPPARPENAQRTTYARAHLPPSHEATLARGENRQRQVLLDKAPAVGSNGLEILTEMELVTKGKLTLSLMGLEAEDAPMGIQFRGAKKLKNGGVVLEMNSVEAANWLRSKDVMERFLTKFDGGTSIIKSRAYSIIVEYVPTSINLETDAQSECLLIENTNDLQELSILTARWIKPPHRRSKGQRTAHLILGLKNQVTANKIIEEGIHIAGKRVWARKLVQEPRRCMKCQKIGAGHLAANCPQTSNTCGTCAGRHRTMECQVSNENEFNCTNCREGGHAAWDRLCPFFMRSAVKFTARNPDNLYRLFPTSDPATWSMLNDQEPPDLRPNQGQREMTGSTDGHQRGTTPVTQPEASNEVRTRWGNEPQADGWGETDNAEGGVTETEPDNSSGDEGVGTRVKAGPGAGASKVSENNQGSGGKGKGGRLTQTTLRGYATRDRTIDAAIENEAGKGLGAYPNAEERKAIARLVQVRMELDRERERASKPAGASYAPITNPLPTPGIGGSSAALGENAR